MKTRWINVGWFCLGLFLVLAVFSTPGAVSLAGRGDDPPTLTNGPVDEGLEGIVPELPDSDDDVGYPESAIRNGEIGSNSVLCDVAVLGATIGGQTWLNDVKAKLGGTGHFNSVDTYNIKISIPSVATMQLYDAILVFSGEMPADKIMLGNNLADYVDGGGGVVTAWAANIINSGPEGRFNIQNYWALPPVSAYINNGSPSGLGTIHHPGHPVMAGVSEIDGGLGSHRADGQTPHPNAVVLADWLDGNPMVAVREDLAAKRVDLNFYPVSADANYTSWLPNTDGALLMGNALSWVGECIEPAKIYLPIIANKPMQSVFWEDFSADPNLGDIWTIYLGTNDPYTEAWWDPVAEEFYLTTAASYKSTAVFADFALPPNIWMVEFDYRIGGGNGNGDGFTFMFFKDETSFAVDPPGTGGMLGFQTSMSVPAEGYGIEFDSVYNPTNFDPPGPHIALIDDSVDQHLQAVLTPFASSGGWHHAVINFRADEIQVKVDGNLLLVYVFAFPETFLTGVGFSAGTGAYYNQHVIDNFRILVPAP